MNITMVTSQDVARLANVSQATVSRAFREDVYINPETKKKVLKAAEELGYYPNYSARSLKNQKSGIIGLMLSDADNMFYTKLTKSMEKYMKLRGYRLMLTYNDEDPDKERECLESLISSRVEGVFCIPVSERNRDLYDVMRKNGIHVVQVIRKMYDDLNTVVINDEMGGYLATSYLLDRGHRNILITEYGFNEKMPVKTAGYMRAFQERGLSSEYAHILDLPFGVDTSALIAGAIVSNNATAIITSNSPMTISALKACKNQGLEISRDISFIAYDDSPWLDLLNITAMTHPMEDIGKSMADMLYKMLDDSAAPPRPVSLEVKPYLLLRNSIRQVEPHP